MSGDWKELADILAAQSQPSRSRQVSARERRQAHEAELEERRIDRDRSASPRKWKLIDEALGLLDRAPESSGRLFLETLVATLGTVRGEIGIRDEATLVAEIFRATRGGN